MLPCPCTFQARVKTFEHISVDELSPKPKYRQIVDSLIASIAAGRLSVHAKLPSINRLSEEFELSRDTVEKAYNILKEKRIIGSVKGKGFYVLRTPLLGNTNVLFLINKLSNYKLRIFNSFRQHIGETHHSDLVVYHCEESLFLNLLKKNENAYDYFIVMPHFRTDEQRHVSTTAAVTKALNAIPNDKLLVLDNNFANLKGNYAEVYQDFENDILGALDSGKEKIARYDHAVIAYPSKAIYPYPKRILRGFSKFCALVNMPYSIVEEIKEDQQLQAGTLYLTIPETDLVTLVKSARDQHLVLGKDIGVISYNETPLKDLLGITTISTDFDQMGKTTAELVLNNGIEQIKNPFALLDRDSL